MERHPLMDADDAEIAPALAAIAARISEKRASLAKADDEKSFDFYAKVAKVDEGLGIVFGWAIICTEKGADYFDTQDDHIPESSMLKAAADFMCHSRVLGDMHRTAEGGSVVFAFPMTQDIAEAFSLGKAEKTGLMIGVKPASAETLAKFKSGEYSGFSIGGRRITDEEVD